MSFSSDYFELRKKKKKDEEKKVSGNSFSDKYSEAKQSSEEKDDIAPVSQNILLSDHTSNVVDAKSPLDLYESFQEIERQKAMQKSMDDKEKLNQAMSEFTSKFPSSWEWKEKGDSPSGSNTWFQSGSFHDGYQFGDVTKAILGTAGDTGVQVVKGISRTGEGLGDLLAYGVAGVADLFGGDSFAYDVKENAKASFTDELFGDTDKYFDQYSVLGDKSGMIGEGLGQLAAIWATGSLGAAGGLGTAGTTALTMGQTGLSSIGSGMSEAYSSGASDEEALTYGLISGTAETLTEMFFGGLGKSINAVGFSKGLLSADDLLAKKVASKFSSQIAKNFAEFGIKAGAEGTEEVLSGIAQAFGKKVTYMSEKEWEDILRDENLLDQFIVATLTSGFAQSGIIPGTKTGSLVEANKTGRDFVTGLSQNEQKVVDKVYEDLVAEAEKNGKVSGKDKSEIYQKVLDDLEKGYLDTDKIEEVLGGKTYEDYKATLESEDSVLKEFESLYEGDELKRQTEDFLKDSKRYEAKDLLSKEVYEQVKDGKLGESYLERARRSESFTADLSKYDTKYHTTIQNAINSGTLNNTRRTHELVDMVAKISADKGVLFDFTNNEKIKGTSFAVEGKIVNGYVTESGDITLNVESPKYLNTTVGHEITHVLEGTEFYNTLQKTIFEYAKSKNDYNDRLTSLIELYKGVKGYEGVDGFKKIQNELTADLVGDYLFTDSDFVQRLSTQHRNVFQKIYDEIKYLYSVATAGSKEARQLEKVKKTFEEAYRGDGTKNTAISGVKYSIAEPFVDSNGNRFENAVLLDTDFFNGTSPRNWGEKLRTLVNERSSKNPFILPVTDENGNTTMLQFASQKDRVKKDGGASHRVLDELSMTTDNISKLAVVHIDEIVSVSEESLPYHTDENSHQWLDKNGWLHRNANVINQKNGNIYNLTIDIAKAADGRTILYATDGKIKKVGNAEVNSLKIKGSGQDSNFDTKVAQNGENVKYSLSDSDGKQLTKEQQEYFKDSKMRDESGNLKVMYHGSQDAGFHVFDAQMSDDGTSFFFVDRNDVAASYSGTTETYEAKAFKTAEDANKFFESIGKPEYEVIEKDGKYRLREDEGYSYYTVAESESLEEIYQEFCDYEGVGYGDANYKVYLNLTNPLVVDADGRNWDNVTREFSQEIADRYTSLTAEEKATLHDLAGWGDIREFRHELNKALDIVESRGGGDGYTRRLASAYQKLGEDINMYDLFSIAEDNFSDLAIEEWAVKQMNTRDYAQKAKAEGYDGVIFKNIHDNGGYSNGSEGASTVAVAFDSNQIKSVANAKPTADADIRYSISEYTAEEKIAHNKAVLDHFGKTYKWAETGYVLLDGSRLDLSGKHEGAPGGYRTVDHRDITDALGSDYGGDSYSGSLVQFMSEGNIRISPESDGINLSVKPTKAQEQALSDFISRARGEVLLDIDDFNGYTVVSVEYPRGTHSSKVLNDIREWFDNGKEPQVSNVSQFRYSLSEDTEGRQLSKEQSEYFKYSKIRDANGSLMVMYHGTPNGDYTVFKDGTYFTPNKEYADKYQNPGASSLSVKQTASNPKTFEVYLDIKKPFDISDAEARRIYIEDYIKGGNAVGINPYLTDAEYSKINTIDWTEGEDLRDFLIENDYDYDGLILDEGATGGYGDEVKSRGKSYVVFRPEQVKNVDNKTPTSDPDIRHSLSDIGEQPRKFGNFNVSGKDVMLESAPVQETAPVIEKPVSETVAPVAENVAPVKEAYEAIKPKQSKEPRMARATKEEQARDSRTAKILFDQKQTPKQKSAWKWAREHIFSRGAVFEDMSLKTGNRELQAKFDNIRRAESRAQTFMGKGKGNAKALVDVRKMVEDSGKTEDFNYYLYHLHNVDRMTLEQRFKDVPNKSVFGDSVDAEVSRKAALGLEVLNPEFKQWAEDVYAINRHLRQMMVDEGVISQETADLWQEMYPHYVPISRADAKGLNVNVPLDTKRTGINAPIKKATGGNSDFYNVFDTMGSRIEQTYKAIAKNRFGVELMDTLGTAYESDVADIDTVLETMDQHEELLQEGKNGESPSFTVFQNGERVKFAITEDMYDAMKPSQFTYTNKALKKINDIRRDILTTYSPTFALTNPIKDVQDILLNSQHPAKTYATIPEAIYSVISKNHWYQERMENGGNQDSYFDGQTRTFKKEDGWFKKVVGYLPSKIQAANEIIEQVPRMAEYIASRKMGRSVDVSMLDAARVTTNFGAPGDFTNMLNRNGFTFLGASVEGFNQQVRNVREAKAEGLKGWAKLAGKYLVAGLPALLLNHALWDDDEEYEELSDYVKQNYYIVGKTEDGKFIRIPKGRAVSVIQDAFNQMENLITGNDDVDLESFGKLVVNNLAPNNPLENNLIAPIVQATTNKTWYGDDLVPTRLQDVPVAEQFDETTDSISKWLGEATNTSPYKWNYLLDQYTGGVGDMVLPYLTTEADGGGLGAAFRDKFVSDPVLKNQNVTDFYDKVDELTVNANSSKATDEDILMSKYMSSVSSEMGKLYQQKREIQNSNLSDEEKYAQVRAIQQQIDDLAREGLATYEDVNIDNGYATIGDLHYRWYEPGEDSNAEPGWQKITDKQLKKQEKVTSALGIDGSEYWSNKEEYDFAYESPEKYAVAKAVGGYTAYKTYASELYDIKADKDSSGKTISGSRKEKVLDYINNLDADYGEKLILFKSEYNADDTYNYEIIDYLNSREDIDYEEMETILKELGFDVSSDGTITWD